MWQPAFIAVKTAQKEEIIFAVIFHYALKIAEDRLK